MTTLLAGPVVAYTQQDLLDLLERLFPAHYLDPLKSPGPGYEILQAAAAMGARVSLAIERLGAAAYILSSSAGAYATGTVEFYRDAVNLEGIDVTILPGTTVQSSKGGRLYQTTEEAFFDKDVLGPLEVGIRASFQGYQYNEPGVGVTADGTTLEGEIDTIVHLVEDPAVGDVTFKVRQIDPTTGGKDAPLDQHGADRLIFRGPGENDDSYSGRIRALPDNISPDAVDRALQQLLLPYGLSYQFLETFQVSYQTCWDAPPDSIPGSVYDPTCFCYDDPRSTLPFRNRWLDENDHRGAFIVVVPRFGPLVDYGFAYDDISMSASDLANPYGARAVGSWDTLVDIGFGYVLPAWDGYDLPRATAMRTLYDTLQNIKAAGISAALEPEGV